MSQEQVDRPLWRGGNKAIDLKLASVEEEIDSAERRNESKTFGLRTTDRYFLPENVCMSFSFSPG